MALEALQGRGGFKEIVIAMDTFAIIKLVAAIKAVAIKEGSHYELQLSIRFSHIYIISHR